MITVTPIVSLSMFENILSDVAAPVGFRIKYRILPFITELLNLDSNVNDYYQLHNVIGVNLVSHSEFNSETNKCSDITENILKHRKRYNGSNSNHKN